MRGNKNDHPLYKVWSGLIQRVKRNQAKGSKERICSAWRDSFEDFVNSVGPRPPKTFLTRLNPEDDWYGRNCKWLTEAQIKERTKQRRKQKKNKK